MTCAAILASEIMTKNLVTLSPDLDVCSAIDVLLRKRISGAPVVDSDGTFVGIFSESSAMRVIVNAAYDNLPDAGLLAFVDRSPPTIKPDTDLLTICQTFLDQATRRLPVIGGGRLLGQVSRRDVMRKVSELGKGKRCGHRELLYLSALSEGHEQVAMRLG
ncbi:MAG: CBS domain-containing protein [Planctomycetales bacterium]|nr:CBS domain-containing protein [Planctomycetales bacterium]